MPSLSKIFFLTEKAQLKKWKINKFLPGVCVIGIPSDSDRENERELNTYIFIPIYFDKMHTTLLITQIKLILKIG